ncbi:MAG: hypothetical protein HOV87_36025 [Catenulispora sp.]|nr:hypothetical protein [Catenulispora sp.]
MGETLTYADALKILGHRKSRLAGLLDAIGSVGLTVWTATAGFTGADMGVPLNMFELKNDIVRHAHALLAQGADWRSGLSRFDRTQRLAAAHAVLVVSVYFEALDTRDLPVPLERLALSREEQTAQATGERLPRDYVELIEVLASDRMPLPECHSSYAQTRLDVRRVHERLAGRLRSFVKGLAVWDALDDGERTRLTDAIAGPETLRAALKRYDDAFRALAADNHEFAVWASLTEAHALGAGLAGVSELLGVMAARRDGDRSRAYLSRNYQAMLDEPLMGSAQSPEGVVLPTLREAYINPRCQVAEVNPGDKPEDHGWWQGREVVDDVERLLAGFLTSPGATQAPLVVLGEPGSGKSTFTEVLAARLPVGDFLPVRVELRAVPAESMIQEQIEHAVYRELGERVSWHDLVEAGDGALPVVLLDGFDELLQASGVNRYDYLEQVRDFQRVQARIGHPLVAVVTSRTVTAGRTRFPIGTLTIRLQPFSDDQIHAWLSAWNRHNSGVLAKRGLLPLTVETALEHRELAEQPLLLMLLALFDATANALQNRHGTLEQAQLYRALLLDFSLREVRKSTSHRGLATDRQLLLAEREMHRLAIVALAMFVRRRQAVSAAELDQDLSVLFDARDSENPDAGHDPPSPSEQVTSRFFFLHKSEATAHGEHTRSYEFLHSTFGEFLVSWLTIRALCDLAAVREVMRRGMTGSQNGLDDGFLYALLSFACLAERRPTVDFLAELLTAMPGDERARIRQMLPELLASSLYPHPSRSHQGYEPTRDHIPRRLAAYSANLTLLAVLVADEEIDVAELYEPSQITDQVVGSWHRYAGLWHGQFSSHEWNCTIDLMRVRIERDGEQMNVYVRREDGSPVSLKDSVTTIQPPVSYDLTRWEVLADTDGALYDIEVPPMTTAGRIIRETAFLPNWRTGMLLLQNVPFLRATGPTVRWHAEDVPFLPGALLAELDYNRDVAPERRAAMYRRCSTVMAGVPELREQLLLRLGDDIHALTPSTTVELLRAMSAGPPSHAYLHAIDRLWRRAVLDGTRKDPNTRHMVVALVKAVLKASPDVALNHLSRDLLVAARTSNEWNAA